VLSSTESAADVRARRLTITDLEAICVTHPRAGMAILQALGRDVAGKVRQSTQRMARSLVIDAPDAEVDLASKRAAEALRFGLGEAVLVAQDPAGEFERVWKFN